MSRLEAPRTMLAIAGPTRSGKSTLAENLTRHYGERISTIPLDELTLTRDELLALPKDADLWNPDGTINYEHPDVYQTHLYTDIFQKLRAGHDVIIPANLRASREQGITEHHIHAREIVAFVGFMSLWNTQVPYDLAIYLDIPPSVMRARRIATAIPGRFVDKPGYIENVLLPSAAQFGEPQKALVQRSHPDHIIDATQPIEAVAARAIQIIEQSRQR